MVQYKYTKMGSKHCQFPACLRAIKSGYQLCMKHHLNTLGKERLKVENAKLTPERTQEIIAQIASAETVRTQQAVSKLMASTSAATCATAVTTHCTQLSAKRVACGKPIEPELISKGGRLCRMHQQRADYLAKKTAKT